MKEINGKGGPLSVEHKLKLITLTKEDEFFIIGSDGIWDVFTAKMPYTLLEGVFKSITM